MKKVLVNYGGEMIMFLILILGIAILCSDFLSPKENTSGLGTTSVMSK